MKRGPAAGVGQRRVAPGYLGEVGIGLQADRGQALADRGSRDRRPLRRGRDEDPGAGQRGGAQQRTDLAAEAAARDEHQALGELGELEREHHRDAAAERVPDDRCPFVAERDQQIAQRDRVRGGRVVAGAGGRAAVSGEVRRDNGVAACQRLHHRLPVLVVAGHPMDQQQHRSGADLHVTDQAAVQSSGLRLHQPHMSDFSNGDRKRSCVSDEHPKCR